MHHALHVCACLTEIAYVCVLLSVHVVLCCRCARVSCAALQELLQGCKQLRKLVLPLQLDVAPLLVGRSHALEQDEEQDRQMLLLQHDVQ